MTCADARDLVLAHARGALPPGDDAAVREHLASCAACARVDHVDRMLSEVLEQRLPQHPASLALKRRLAAEWPAPPRARTSFKRFVMPALAAAAVVLALRGAGRWTRLASAPPGDVVARLPGDRVAGGRARLRPRVRRQRGRAQDARCEGDGRAGLTLIATAAGRSASPRRE